MLYMNLSTCTLQLLDEFTQVLLQDLQNKDDKLPNPEKLDKHQVRPQSMCYM